jgi:hypothetical protein
MGLQCFMPMHYTSVSSLANSSLANTESPEVDHNFRGMCIAPYRPYIVFVHYLGCVDVASSPGHSHVFNVCNIKNVGVAWG